jgi:hypothetical protein
VSPEEAALARQALRSAEGGARRLARSQGKLAAQFPLSPARVTALPPDVEDDLDAFLKRYEQLVNTIQDELFKVVAIVGGEGVDGARRGQVEHLHWIYSQAATRWRARGCKTSIAQPTSTLSPSQPGHVVRACR